MGGTSEWTMLPLLISGCPRSSSGHAHGNLHTLIHTCMLTQIDMHAHQCIRAHTYIYTHIVFQPSPSWLAHVVLPSR